jgi:hypothetical protein
VRVFRVSYSLLFPLLLGLYLTTLAGPLPGGAQEADCGQPSERGCPIVFDQPVRAALTDATRAHIWRIMVTRSDAFSVILVELPAAYRLYVYGPEGDLLGETLTEGRSEARVEIRPRVAGTYIVIVDSPAGYVSPDPYVLVARDSLVASPSDSTADLRTAAPSITGLLLNETFEDPAQARVPSGPGSGYEDGHYVFRITNPRQSPLVTIPILARDVEIVADVRSLPSSVRFPNLNCRVAGGNFYRLLVDTRQGYFRIARFDEGISTTLLQENSLAIQPADAVNRLGLACAGSTLRASMNGIVVGMVIDDNYAEGYLAIGVGGPDGEGVVEFDDLVIRQL